MKMTIRKIAELAGVSRGTVDKVVHGRRGVSDEVRQKVQGIIEETGYTLPETEKKPVEKTYRVVVIMPRTNNPFFASIKHGMDAMRKVLPEGRILVEYSFCDGSDVAQMLYLINCAEEQGMHGLLLRGVQSHRLSDRLNRLYERKIPVVLFDADVTDAKRLCFVGEDSYASGRVAASLLAKSINGKGEVAVIGGMENITSHYARLRGFEDVIRERFPGIKIVEEINCLDQSAIAYEKTRLLLQKYPNLKGIFSVVGCTGDIGQALLERQQQTIKMVCYNFTQDITALVKRNVVDFSIGLMPNQQGMNALQIMSEYLLEGKKPKKDFMEIPLVIGVDENIDQLTKNEII